MIQESLGWLILLVVPIAYGLLWLTPATQPFAKKLWWVAVLFVATGVCFILLRRSPHPATPKTSEKEQEEGKAIAQQTQTMLDTVVESAQEAMVEQDLVLARRRLESEQAIATFDARIQDAKKIEDSVERRKALIRIVQGA